VDNVDYNDVSKEKLFEMIRCNFTSEYKKTSLINFILYYSKFSNIFNFCYNIQNSMRW
jgi:hypothetical protein